MSWLQLTYGLELSLIENYKIRTRRCRKCNAICNDERMTKCHRCGGRIE